MQNAREATKITEDDEDDEDRVEAIVELRNSILESYIMLLKGVPNAKAFLPQLPTIFEYIEFLWQDKEYRTKEVVFSVISLIGYEFPF